MVESLHSFEEFRKIAQERRNCGYFTEEDTTCEFYGDSCSHYFGSRCYKARPRTKKECQPWMIEICLDCNESVCNDCDVFKDQYHLRRATSDLELHLRKPKFFSRKKYFYI